LNDARTVINQLPKWFEDYNGNTDLILYQFHRSKSIPNPPVT
jgi:hypothetical protein